jgi:hypothetical protein
MLRPWWERWPGRLEYELRKLEAAGIRYEIDEESRSQNRIVLRLNHTVGGEELSLLALFPDVYPYTRFDLRALNLDLPRHQQPFSKGLCLIGRATENWDIDNTLADFITDRIPMVLQSAASDDQDEIALLEEHQGEPFSDYYRYAKDAMVLIDSSWSIDREVAGGILTIGVEERTGEILRGAVIKISDEKCKILATADQAIARLYKKQIDFRWIRHHEPVREENLDRFFETISEQNSRLRNPKWKVMTGVNMDVVGVLFPEEHGWRESAEGWVFGVRIQKVIGRTRREGSYLARAGRSGRRDMAERVPELMTLSERKVSVIGLGGLGGPSAIEFARCGVGELRILDNDHVDPATVRRWPLGLRVAGLNKAECLALHISGNYPYTDVLPFARRIGDVREASNEKSDLKILGDLFEGANLVYDATAEVGIQHLLSDLAAERGIDYICVSTTSGAWGGRIVRIRSGQTKGCWVCLMHWIAEGKIPSPPADPAGGVQPAGCGDPTFTGAGFDVASIALGGVRLAAATLARGAQAAYPDADWDVAVISLRNENGLFLAPRWETFNLDQHSSCKNVQAHRKSVGLASGL